MTVYRTLTADRQNGISNNPGKGSLAMPSCLVVDDSKVIRRVARYILESLNIHVDEAGDGREALEMCDEKLPDVVLLDWNMPIMTGLDFLKELSRRNFAQPPKVIFCTTENGLDHVRAAIDAGADEYVMKPFDRDTLESKLQIVGVL